MRRVGARHVDRAEVHDGRVVGWNIDHAWLRGFDANDLALLHDRLLIRVDQVTLGLRHSAELLHGGHHVLGLPYVRLPECNRPLLTLGHQVQHRRVVRHGADADVPRLVIQSIGAVTPHVGRGGGNLFGIGRGNEHLREDGIRIERNGREEVLELLRAPRFRRDCEVRGLLRTESAGSAEGAGRECEGQAESNEVPHGRLPLGARSGCRALVHRTRAAALVP